MEGASRTVAACVPYSKRKQEWIMAILTEDYSPDDEIVCVKDLFPDKKKRVHSWKVSPSKIIPFPAAPSERFEKGTVVLSLWKQGLEWSSVFYRAVVFRTPQIGDTEIEIRYDGDEMTYLVFRDKVVPFEPLGKNKSGQKHSGSTGGSSRRSGGTPLSPSSPGSPNSNANSPNHNSFDTSPDSSDRRRRDSFSFEGVGSKHYLDSHMTDQDQRYQPSTKRMRLSQEKAADQTPMISPAEIAAQQLQTITTSSMYRTDNSSRKDWSPLEKRIMKMAAILQAQPPLPASSSTSSSSSSSSSST
eukprot:TRINITY_DN3402_c0_g1_i1.p1 TRINITY_DN3402_c0_g1~~TRINITY_DN3402_c0_g1_i1.p1  ORF type:complete len:315 (+),score=95.91 TRINITY_DN3402_c0_g1_i1:43-945(+)